MTRGRKCALEALERRTLLAGDVQVFLDSKGNLIVIGDGLANGIQVDQFGEFVIQGIDAGGSPTRINGVENDIAVFEVAGRHDIRISLNGGDDFVEVGTRSDDVNPPRDLSFDLGDGGDALLVIGDTNIGRDLLVNAGAGEDEVFIVSLELGRDVTVNQGNGDDVLEVYGSRIGDDLHVNAGGGADTVSVGLFNGPAGRVEGAVTVHGATAIDLGSGDDVLELVASNFGGVFRASGGAGSDTLIDDALSVFARKPSFGKFEIGVA